MDRLKPALVRQIFVLMLILFLTVLIFKEIIPYLSGVLGAITLYVLLRNWMKKLLARGWKPPVAAALLMAGSFVGILVPIILIVIMLTSKISKAVANSERVIRAVKEQLNEAETYIGYSVSESIDTSSVANWMSGNLQSLAGGTFDAFIAIGIMYFMLYYMLVKRDSMKSSLISYIPLGNDNLEIIAKESDQLVKSNALGIPLVAIFQGIIALIGYLIFGVPDPFFWFVITAIGSMIPFIGTAIGILPVVILLIAQGDNWQAIAMLIYGFVVVGSTDNIIRLYILDRLAAVHPLITLFGVIVGVQLFGFIGLIFGPLLISLFLLILKIYKKEYGNAHDRL
ncbi:AI-2E family transporter [Salegentibacter salegens]|uniref:Predicted PurR-regulated permease PerM n=1 Tax=Salegentibacter salegens TaxID=143223 RepID=A0A1M7I014_9FLAO|nr:AI-2E family transporter [Salegentibacter salegens]PRX45280.1 putative PurR-regulated permease PerM [Salegentibacter salegens]SHM34055.1 Predicted PurR-regulated permease PerM [Salegentibacter salegens]